MTDPSKSSRAAEPSAPPPIFPSEEVWAAFSNVEVVKPPIDAFTFSAMTARLGEIAEAARGAVAIAQAGSSVEGRSLSTVRLGSGPRRVLVWARQHGDEAICSAALMAALNYLARRGGDPAARDILRGATLLVAPMVNPDGVERLTRRNALGIDVNRDARRLTTPEGQFLRRLKDEFQPEAAFNLHDMGRRKSRSTDGQLVALAFQACFHDESGGDSETRIRSKRICVRMCEAVGARAYNRVARYDVPHMPRAFGDAMMQWGVATNLIESGGWLGPDEASFVTRLHFLALLAGLHAVATGSDATANAAYYDTLPFESGKAHFDLLVRGATVFDGMSRPPLDADVAVNCEPRHRRAQDERFQPLGVITDMGDLDGDHGKTEIDGRDTLLMPGFVAVAPGLRIRAAADLAALDGFLEAGVTTVVAGCGPFGSQREFTEWRREIPKEGLATNLALYEAVESIEAISERHAQTQAHGLLVPDLRLKPQDLLAAFHLFHPAAHSALTEEQEDMALTVDLMLRAVGNPARNRLQLLVRPLAEKSDKSNSSDMSDPSALKDLFAAFLTHPSQIGVIVDTTCPPLGIFPMPPMICGVGGRRAPGRDFLGRTLETLHCSTTDHFAMIVSRLSRQPISALGIIENGLVRQGCIADLALFPRRAGADKSPGPPTLGEGPNAVVVNGRLALRDSARTGANGGLLIVR